MSGRRERHLEIVFGCSKMAENSTKNKKVWMGLIPSKRLSDSQASHKGLFYLNKYKRLCMKIFIWPSKKIYFRFLAL